MRRITAFLVLSCILGGCAPKEFYHVKLAHEIEAPYMRDVTATRHFSVSMTGGKMMGDIQDFGIGFACLQTPGIRKARILYVVLAENFLSRVNAWEPIRPWLHDYPATNANLNLQLMFYGPDKRTIDNGKLAFVFPSKGKIVYCRYNLETDFLDTVHVESYEEALQLVREQHPELLLQPLCPAQLFALPD